MLKQSLPCGQAGYWQACAHRKVDVAGQWREVAGLHGDVLSECAVAIPVRQAEHPLADRQPRGAIAQPVITTGQLMAENRWRPVTKGRSVQVEGQSSSVLTKPAAWTSTTTSFIAACGSGRSTSFIPAVPAAWSVTTIAFMGIVSSDICWLDKLGVEDVFDLPRNPLPA